MLLEWFSMSLTIVKKKKRWGIIFIIKLIRNIQPTEEKNTNFASCENHLSGKIWIWLACVRQHGGFSFHQLIKGLGWGNMGKVLSRCHRYILGKDRWELSNLGVSCVNDMTGHVLKWRIYVYESLLTNNYIYDSRHINLFRIDSADVYVFIFVTWLKSFWISASWFITSLYTDFLLNVYVYMLAPTYKWLQTLPKLYL